MIVNQFLVVEVFQFENDNIAKVIQQMLDQFGNYLSISHQCRKMIENDDVLIMNEFVLHLMDQLYEVDLNQNNGRIFMLKKKKLT